MNQVTIFLNVYHMVPSMPLKMNHLDHIQVSDSSVTILTQIISFHKVKKHWFAAGLWWNPVQCQMWGLGFCEDAQSSAENPNILLMSSQILCSAAMNSSCWPSNAANFTWPWSDIVEILWRAWKLNVCNVVILLQVTCFGKHFHQFLLKRYSFQPQQGYWKYSISE